MLVRLLGAVMALVTAAVVVVDGTLSIADQAVQLTEVGAVWPETARFPLPGVFDDLLAAVSASPLVIWCLMLTGVLVLAAWASEFGAG